MTAIVSDAGSPLNYDDAIKQQESDKLQKLSRLTNENADLTKTTVAIQNMTLKAVLATTLQTLVDILQDLSTRTKPLPQIFLATDRIFYVGIVVIFIAFCVWILHI